ncbi:MAG: porin family protein [Adhaeribacter sp.]
MKKISLAVLFFLITSTAFAQWEIGIKITPSIATNRVVAPKEFGFKSLNAKTHFGGGVIADYFFRENYAISTGLIYNTRGAGVSYLTPNGSANQKSSDEFAIQYLEIPVTLKLFTNEIATDMKLYFQAGGSLDPRITAKVNNEKLANNNDKYTRHFNILDISVLLGSGVEMQLGESTKVFGGLSYHRGLIDVDNFYEKRGQFNNNNISIKNTYVALDLGLKF